ncbi:MAG: XRE family transcriptional regulator [Okeania sp. SIO2H7]|nr:XRE family transcriptional regulator [Okeania sp. SIO2H7]
MLENPNLVFFVTAVAVGSILIIFLRVLFSGDRFLTINSDSPIYLRLKELGFSTWEDWVEKHGLSRESLPYLAGGNFEKVTLGDLRKLATSLKWSLTELIDNLGLDYTGKIPQQELLEEKEELRRECGRLRDRLQQQKAEITADVRESTFQQLQSLLTNYPSIRPMTEVKPNLPAKNLVSLLAPLDNLLESWDYEAIGKPWEEVSFNPQLHQADSDEIAEGDLVYIRFVGYRNGEKILAPAKVSRTLPGGNK